MTDRQSPRSAVLVAAVLGIAGVGLIGSGIGLLLSGDGDVPEPTVTTVPTAAPTTTSPGPTTTVLAPPTTAAAPLAFVVISDDSGTMRLEVPAAWADVSTSAWTRQGEEIGPSIAAAVDRPAWVEGWDTPGLFVGVTTRIGPEEAHGDFSGACLPDRTETIVAGEYSGTGDWWWWCGDGASSFFVAVLDLGEGRVALFQILDSPEALPAVVERVLASFSYEE
ncbi:MAG TPA: hypothetical protein VFY15_01290 [Acidimicrobiia bacterium]|nr:hypothetical protein [Acidimicrobiia bacterium]